MKALCIHKLLRNTLTFLVFSLLVISQFGPNLYSAGAEASIAKSIQPGDSDSFSRGAPNPNIQVRPNSDQVEGFEWTLADTVTIRIDDLATPTNPDYTASQTVGVDEKDPARTYVNFDLAGVFDIKTGFVVSMTNGLTTKFLTVSPLAFTSFDIDLDRVYGVADSNVNVSVWTCDGTGCNSNRNVTSDAGGNWMVDFSIPGTSGQNDAIFNLVNGSWVDSAQPDQDGDRTQFGQSISLPSIEVSPGSHWVHARGGWPEAALITMTIDDPSNGTGVDYTDAAVFGQNPDNPTDPNDRRADFDLDGFALHAGQAVSMTAAPISINYTIQPLEFTAFDLDADTVSGTAAAGRRLSVSVNTSAKVYRYVTVTGAGDWTADFHNPVPPSDGEGTADLLNGSNGWAADFDDHGNQTWLDWSVPNPNLAVRANEDLVEGYEWTLADTVTIHINDLTTPINPDYTASQTVGVDEKDPARTFVGFELAGVFDVKTGFVVSMTDGLTTKSLIVSTLAFTGFDIDLDRVYGVADSNASVDVWACDGTGCYNRAAATDAGGNWMVDFSIPGTTGKNDGIFDLVNDAWVDSAQPDQDGDRTQFGERISLPYIEVSPGSHWVHARGSWPEAALITMTIDDPSNGAGVDYSAAAVFGQNPDNPTDPNDRRADFDLDGFALHAGQAVSMTAAPISISYTIQPLEFTAFDLLADTVSGTAAAGHHLSVGVNTSAKVYRYVTAAGDGNWTADFHNPVPPSDGEATFDLVAGSNGWAADFDDHGNQTRLDWSMPNPNIQVRPNSDQVEGMEWTLADTVTIRINDLTTPINPDYTASQAVGVDEKDPARTYVNFDLAGVFDVKTGFVVSMTDGLTTKSLIVSTLAFASFDIDLDRVYGVADSNASVDVWACDGTGCYDRAAATDAGGNWMVDFSIPGTSGKNDAIFNLLNGTWVDSAQPDQDGDRTQFGETISLPSIEVNPGSHWVHARGGWPEAALITMTIDDPSNGAGVDYSAAASFGPNPANPTDPNDWRADFDLHGFALQAGQAVSMTAGSISISYTIRTLEFTAFDLLADTVSGTAAAGRHVAVGVNTSAKVYRYVTVTGAGNWTADFHSPVAPSDGEGAFDLLNGSNGWAADYDDHGNQTSLDWTITVVYKLFLPLVSR